MCVSIFLSQLNDKNDTPCFNRILPRMIVNTPEDDKKAKPASRKTNTVTELLGMDVVLTEMAKMTKQNSEAIDSTSHVYFQHSINANVTCRDQ